MAEQPIQWIKNTFKKTLTANSGLEEILPAELPREVRDFHRRVPGYHMSPLESLTNLAAKFGLGGIWVKDESARLDLQSFKVLGGSNAIYRLIQRRVGLEGQEIAFTDLSLNGAIQLLSQVSLARLPGER